MDRCYLYITHLTLRKMIRINTELLTRFLTSRLVLGQPSRQDIIASIQRTDTRHVLPPGWQYR
jgi:hypothetical protein